MPAILMESSSSTPRLPLGLVSWSCRSRASRMDLMSRPSIFCDCFVQVCFITASVHVLWL